MQTLFRSGRRNSRTCSASHDRSRAMPIMDQESSISDLPPPVLHEHNYNPQAYQGVQAGHSHSETYVRHDILGLTSPARIRLLQSAVLRSRVVREIVPINNGISARTNRVAGTES